MRPGLLLLLLLPTALPAQSQPAWSIAPVARDSLAALWRRSLSARREEVACLGGRVETDTVRIVAIESLGLEQADSLTADARASLEGCGPPRWIGTVHTHVRSTDDDGPAPRFSPSDRTVMSLWSARWGRQGAFCVLYSGKAAHCEVYPPRSGAARSP